MYANSFSVLATQNECGYCKVSCVKCQFIFPREVERSAAAWRVPLGGIRRPLPELRTSRRGGERLLGRSFVARLDVDTAGGCAAPRSAISPDPISHVAAPVTASPAAAAGLAAAAIAQHAVIADAANDMPLPAYMGTRSSSMDSDGEMCTLVSVPSGDVQLVCDSDPTHPISLAERAALHPALSTTLLQDIEAKLEADLTTVAFTILFAVGFIFLEFGVDDLIDIYFGDDLLSDVICISLGLVVVFWARLGKTPLIRFDRWR